MCPDDEISNDRWRIMSNNFLGPEKCSQYKFKLKKVRVENSVFIMIKLRGPWKRLGKVNQTLPWKAKRGKLI